MSLFVRGRVKPTARGVSFLFSGSICEDRRISSCRRHVLYLVTEEVFCFGRHPISGRWPSVGPNVLEPLRGHDLCSAAARTAPCLVYLHVLAVVLSTQRLKFGPACVSESEGQRSERQNIFVLTLFKNIR